MNRLISWAITRGWRRGVLGGSRAWLIVGAAALGWRLVSRTLKRQELVVFREAISPGQAMVIDHLPVDRRGRATTGR